MLAFEVRPGRIVSGPARLVALLLVVALALAGLPLRPAATPSLLAASWQLPSHSAIGDLLGLEDGAAARPDPSEAHISRVAQASFGKLPLSFVPNRGQSDAAVRFQARGLGGTLSFRPDEVVLSLPGAAVGHGDKKQTEVVHLRFVGANAAPAVLGGDRLPGVVNLFIGNDPAHWQRNLPTYADITYKALYPGIDLRYDGREGHLKSTYVVSPGADSSQIRWRYDGAAGVAVDAVTGDLRITLAAAVGRVKCGVLRTKCIDVPRDTAGADPILVERAPVAWQEIDGQFSLVPVSYSVAGNGSIGFRVGTYDPAYPLIVDPTLTFSTYLGGSHHDVASAIAIDAQGDIYVAGSTSSGDFPTFRPVQPFPSGGYTDAFVIKVDMATNTLVYSTYLGGGGSDDSLDMAVDGLGNVYVTGVTRSYDFPTRHPLQENNAGEADAFIAKLSASGDALLYSTYLGSPTGDAAWGIALDRTGRTTISGYTSSPFFPVEKALQPAYGGSGDAFVAKLAPAGDVLVYSTYLGGSGEDSSLDVALDQESNVYVTGHTRSDDFPTIDAWQDTKTGRSSDVFVAKLDPAGERLVYSTYLGGSSSDIGDDIAVDSAGNVYLTGDTYSSDFPTVNPIQAAQAGDWDAFVAKLSAAGNRLLYSTYLGGTLNDGGSAIAVDAVGSATIVGSTASDDFPVVAPLQGDATTGADAVVAKLNNSGTNLIYSTYFGGNGNDSGVGIALDGAAVYIVGRTTSTDLPTIDPIQAEPGDSYYGEGYIARIADPWRVYLPVVLR